MEKWKSKHEPALDLKSNPEQFVNEVLIEGNKVCDVVLEIRVCDITGSIEEELTDC